MKNWRSFRPPFYFLDVNQKQTKSDIEIKSTGIIITNEAGEVETKFNGASVTFKLEDGTVYFVHVDLAKEKVIRVSPPIYRKEQ